jgi:hydrogenase 3 maturation protease
VPNGTRRNTAQKDLADWLKKAARVVVAGIGNPIRMDDFVGVKILQDLHIDSKKIFLIECETVPESYVQQIVNFNPTHILLLDAALSELRPGEWKLVRPDSLLNSPAYSSHLLPLKIFCEYLSKATSAEISLLLIQPQRTDFGENLSPEVSASAKKIAKFLQESLSKIK